jgi:hypothetical protein
MFIFVINYCSNMFRPQFLAIFRELANLLTYTAYVVTYVEEMDFKHQCLNNKLYTIVHIHRSHDTYQLKNCQQHRCLDTE